MEGSIHVLHVDDDPQFGDLTATVLEEEFEKFTVRTASSTDEGLDYLAGAAVDCVVSDYDMPERTGIEFLEAVRERRPNLPVILFTGKGSEEVASDAISAGVTDYLQKQSGTEQYDLLTNRITAAVRQYRTERELERQNDLFARAQRIADVGAWEYDLTGEASYMSDEAIRIHDLDPEAESTSELSPAEALKYYHPDDRDILSDAFEQATERGEPFDLELRLFTDDGSQRWVRKRGEPQTEDGDVVRIRGTIQDITDRKRRERQLERKNERLEEFAQVVSHDLRNPLQVAKGRLELVRRTGDHDPLEAVAQAHERMETILEDMLTLAKQGEEIGERETVLVDEVAREAWETVDTSSITLQTFANCQVDADRERLRQLLENLFRNAVEHGTTSDRTESEDAVEHAGPDVTVTVGPIDPMPTTTRGGEEQQSGFYVADDGPGISDDRQETVFESGHTTSDDGTGFGLAIVAQIADAHGWDVSVRDSESGGARFEFVDGLGTPQRDFA